MFKNWQIAYDDLESQPFWKTAEDEQCRACIPTQKAPEPDGWTLRVRGVASVHSLSDRDDSQIHSPLGKSHVHC